MLVNAKNIGVDWHSIHEAPEFSYVLTDKQFNRVVTLCRKAAWGVPNIRGIHITLGAIEHVISSRFVKDGCEPCFVADILVTAYHELSQVAMNKSYGAQALMFNTGKKLSLNGQKYYALAVVEVRKVNEMVFLAPVTAYHATEAKIRGIQV